MKTVFPILFFISVSSTNLSAQKSVSRNELNTISHYIKTQDLDSFIITIHNLAGSLNQNNIAGRLILIDTIFAISDGVFAEGCDTILSRLQKEFMLPFVKFLSHKKGSGLESAYINFVVNSIIYSGNRNISKSDFNVHLQIILPNLSGKETDYALSIKSIVSELIKQN
jgi:hypothetical protein